MRLRRRGGRLRRLLLRAVQACIGRLGAAALSPSRGRTQRPGKAGSAGAHEQTSFCLP